MSDQILTVNNLKVSFIGDYGEVKAVNDISFSLGKGESVAFVGESGCGKSVTALSVMGLLQTRVKQVTTGLVEFEGRNLLALSEKEMLKIRGKKIGMIFQDPMTSLNPLMRVGAQIAEVLCIHEKISKKKALERSVEIIRSVGIPRPADVAHEFPHQLSGGMRQRVMIAIAMACEPEVLIADEPTTALDVTIQAQIMTLMDQLIKKKDMALMLITHDLGIVAEACDRVIVMYAGHIVETAGIHEIFDETMHPYTEGLLKAIPHLNETNERLFSIPGTVPNNLNMPAGCPFAPRCAYKTSQCDQQLPALNELSPGHCVRCWHPRLWR